MLSVQNVSKRYQLYRRPSDRIVETIGFGRNSKHTDFWAFATFPSNCSPERSSASSAPTVPARARSCRSSPASSDPTSGRVSVEGRVAALLELGAGFNPEFTGRENVYFNSEVMGRSPEDTTRVFGEIEAFAEIGPFIDRPVKEYSSGMYVRLAFATAIHVEPDVLDRRRSPGGRRCGVCQPLHPQARRIEIGRCLDSVRLSRSGDRQTPLPPGRSAARWRDDRPGRAGQSGQPVHRPGPRTRPRSRRSLPGQPASRRLVERDPERRTTRRTGPAGNQRPERAAGARPCQSPVPPRRGRTC